MTEDAAELDALRNSIRRVLTEHASRERVQRFVKSNELYDQELWGEAAKLGWLALSIPEADGGLGLGMSGAALLYEELGRSLAPVPVLGTLLVAEAVAAAGTPAQKTAWLPDLASGAVAASLEVIDPKHKTPSVRLRRRPGGDLVLSGDAHDLLDGAVASVLLLTAQAEDGAHYLVLVRPREDAVAVKAEALVDRTRHLAHAHLGDLVLPADRVLGEAPLRAGLIDQLLGHAALALACDGLGLADAVLTLTVEYLKTRVQFGKAIGTFQALKHRCANHKVALEAVRAMTYEAVRHWAEGRSDAVTRSFLAKAHACEMAAVIATDAVQLHGGIGFTWEHSCHLFLKRAKLNEALFGTRAAHEDRAAASSIPAPGHDEQRKVTRRFDPLSKKNDLEAFRSEVRAWLQATIPRNWHETMADADERRFVEFQRDWFVEMKKVGLGTPHWPKEWGGPDLSLRHQVIIFEEIAHMDAPTADLYTITLYHLPATLFGYGTPSQRERYLKGALERNEIWCQGFSEPNAGSDLASLRTRAERKGDTYVVNGQKIWSSFGAHADYCLLLARTDPNAPKHAGISYFILDMKSPGLTVRPIRQATGRAEFTEIYLDNVVIPVENRIGNENEGWSIAQSTLSAERGLIIFEHSERLARMLERDLEAARGNGAAWREDDEFRRAYMRVVADMHGLRALIRKMLSEIEANPQMGGALMPPLIKLHYSELLRRYTELRLRIAGLSAQRREPVPMAGGYVSTNLMYDFLWSYAWTIAAGTNEIIRTIVAERILGLPR